MQLLDWNQLILKKPRELIFSGDEGFKRIQNGDNVDEKLFQLDSLNFLEITKTPIEYLPSKVGCLQNLTNLVIRDNRLTDLPTEISQLKKLKLLDVSNNQLTSLPDKIGELSNLQSLILSCNKLSSLPETFSSLSGLLVVKIDQNEFIEFPESLCSENFKQHLSDVCAQRNKIENIPASINNLLALKTLDLSDNNIKLVPKELGDCGKLKEVNLKGNQLTDRKLLKMVEKGKQKMIFDYIKAHCPKANDTCEDASSDNSTKRKARTSKRTNSTSTSSQETRDTIKILSFKPENQKLVIASRFILQERKIVCCIVRNVDLSKPGVIKNFLSLQTALHDGLLCGKRSKATIATHDLSLIEGNVTYDLKPPLRINLVPLGRNREMTAGELYKICNDEADAYRKEKKRSTYSGIHKYLFLLKGKTRYPYLADESGKVISFPPLTNSESTKITEQTKDLFIEVTGESTPVCKKVMDALLHAMLKSGLGVKEQDDDTSDCQEKPNILEVEPVKIVNEEKKLYVTYPSRVDLYFEDINVIRDGCGV